MKTNTRQLTSPSSDFDVRLRNYTEDEAFGSIHDELSQNQASQLFSVVFGKALEPRGAQHACRQGQQLPLSSPGTLASPGHRRQTELPRPSPSGALPQGWKLSL